MQSKDAVLYADDFTELPTMPPDGVVPDGVALVGTTLYVGREARGQILGVNHRPFLGGYRIEYFTLQ